MGRTGGREKKGRKTHEVQVKTRIGKGSWTNKATRKSKRKARGRGRRNEVDEGCFMCEERKPYLLPRSLLARRAEGVRRGNAKIGGNVRSFVSPFYKFLAYCLDAQQRMNEKVNDDWEIPSTKKGNQKGVHLLPVPLCFSPPPTFQDEKKRKHDEEEERKTFSSSHKDREAKRSVEGVIRDRRSREAGCLEILFYFPVSFFFLPGVYRSFPILSSDDGSLVR